MTFSFQQLVTMGSEVATMKENTKALEGLQAFKDDTSSQLTALNTRLRKLEVSPSNQLTAFNTRLRKLEVSPSNQLTAFNTRLRKLEVSP